MSTVLVAYASRTGCTREAAEIIGSTLRAAIQNLVDVRPVQEVTDLRDYSAVVVGSAARQKRGWLSEGYRWLRAHESELAELPVAYFMTCWVLRDDTAETRREAEAYVDLVREKAPGIVPRAVGLFPGRLDLERFSSFDRFWLRMKHAPTGDWFDRERVRLWAEGLPDVLATRSPAGR